MHITLLGGFDPRVPAAGGVRSYVESLGQYLDSIGVPRLTVLAGHELRVSGRDCGIPVRKSGSTAHMLASACANVSLLPVPSDSIIHAQRPDSLLPFALAGIGSSWVCTVHGNPFEGIRQNRSRVAFAAYALLEATLLRRTDQVLFVDRVAAASYRTRYPWLKDSMDVIPNGVDTERFRPADRYEARRTWGLERTTFLYAGRLEPEKQVGEIVRAFRELGADDCELVIAGDGRQRSAVEREARGLRVRFLGTVEPAEMPSLMNAADALILYSSQEGLPTVVLEALACGTPVVATPVGALPDVVRPGENGLFAATRGELKESMNRMRHGELAASSAIRDTVKHYSWRELGPRVVRAYSRAERTARAR